MNFFKILFSVCTETQRFSELAKMPMFRAVLHLIMLATMLSIVVIALRYPGQRETADRISQVLLENFGEVKISDKGILPPLSPEKARKLEIVSGVLLEYFPSTALTEKDLQVADFNSGLIWTPGQVTMWLKNPPYGFVVLPLVISPKALYSKPTPSFMPSTSEDLIGFVKTMDNPAGPFVYKNISDIISNALLCSVLIGYFMPLIIIIFGGLLFTTLFTGFYALGGGTGLAGINFKNLWLIGLYAGFPAMIVAALAFGLNLPYVDFSTIYLFGFLGYFFFIVSRLQRQRMDQKS